MQTIFHMYELNVEKSYSRNVLRGHLWDNEKLAA